MMMERTMSTPSSGVYIKRAHLETLRVCRHLLAASYLTISKNMLNFTRRLLPVVLISFTSTYGKTPMTTCSAAEGMPWWIPPVDGATQEASLSVFLQCSPRHIPNDDSHAHSAVVAEPLSHWSCWRWGNTSTCKNAGDIYTFSVIMDVRVYCLTEFNYSKECVHLCSPKSLLQRGI